MKDAESQTIELYGVTVTLTASAGPDDAPIVFVDTSDSVDDGPNGPAIRIQLNDDPVYTGKHYQPIGSEEVSR